MRRVLRARTDDLGALASRAVWAVLAGLYREDVEGLFTIGEYTTWTDLVGVRIKIG